MRRALLALFTIPLFITTGEAQNNDWSVYQDDTRQCRIEYPSHLLEQGSVDKDGFQTFANRQGDITLRIASRANEGDWTPAQIKTAFVKEISDALIYARVKDNFIVLSGFKDSKIFYSRIAVSKDTKKLCVMHIFYPKAVKLEMDGVVTRMSRSFRAN